LRDTENWETGTKTETHNGAQIPQEKKMSEVTEKRAPSVAETTAAPSGFPTTNAATVKKAPGLSFHRFFTKPGVSPYDEVE